MTETRGIDLRALSLEDALDLAIAVETEARDRYEELADQLELHHTQAAAAFFREMAKNEERHRAALAKRRRAQFADAPAAINTAMLFEVEAPAYGEARMFLTVREALLVARRCEEKAYAFFARIVEVVRDPAVRSVLVELRDEELEHQRLVDAELAKDGGSASPGLEDEPVEH